jgi:flagellum-specific ATP synthase
MTALSRWRSALATSQPIRVAGKVTQVVGLLVEGWVPGAKVGSMCSLQPDGGPPVPAEVVGFRKETALLMPLGGVEGVAAGSSIFPGHSAARVPVGPCLRGRVIDGLGEPMDSGPPLVPTEYLRLNTSPPAPLERQLIKRPLVLGVKSIDGCITCGDGQRLAIVAGSGVGKSVLMGMICRGSQADMHVIALVGERGREVRQFLERDLGPQGLARSVVVVATGDRAPVERIRAAFVATAIAEYFRDQGLHVLLAMDSLTRVAMAQREIGLAIGEPPTTKGYPPSMLALLPRLVERAGPGRGEGSITALYTVLAEADDLDDPVVDAARATLDGHVVLARSIASRGLYPAVDVLASVSRLMNEIVTPRHRELAAQLRSILADYEEAKDLVHVGAYARGTNPRFDRAIERIEAVRAFLHQAEHEHVSLQDTLAQMAQAVGDSRREP